MCGTERSFKEVVINIEQDKRADELIALALELHGDPEAHQAFTLGSMDAHVDEVRGLLEKGDLHWKAETVDILIHCVLLLKSAGVPPDEVKALIDLRLGRFQEKIVAALEGAGKR